jgi:predicted transcriptional regulator
MSDQSTAQKVDPNLVAQIVRSYVAQNSIGVDQVGGLIVMVHRSLSDLGNNTPAPAELVPAVPVRRSVQREYVVCLECGFRGQMLRRHLREHGFDPEQYRARWKLSADHPITAPGYSERRSTMAKQTGLGRKAEVPPPMPEVVAPVAPSPRRRGRKPQSAAAE